MNFAVAFLNLLTLYMLWRAQFLTEFYAVFCIYQIYLLNDSSDLYEICCYFPQNARTLHALESSIFIGIGRRFLR